VRVKAIDAECNMWDPIRESVFAVALRTRTQSGVYDGSGEKVDKSRFLPIWWVMTGVSSPARRPLSSPQLVRLPNGEGGKGGFFVRFLFALLLWLLTRSSLCPMESCGG